FSDKFKTLVAKFAAKGTNGIAILAENYKENQERKNAYYNDEEKGKRRRIVAYAAVIGAGAVGAALAWANWKGHDTTGVTPDSFGGITDGGIEGAEPVEVPAAEVEPGEVFTIDAQENNSITSNIMEEAGKTNHAITTEQSYS